MDLLLWRHAEAELGTPDQTRALTAKGHRQAKKMALWLDRNLPYSCKILVSPAIRAVQTAEALGRKFKTLPELAPGESAAQLLAAANWPHSREPVLVVGHQPALGQAASILIAGLPQEWAIPNACVWWIVRRNRDNDEGNFIRTVMTPDLVVK
ncbi:MAG TPA: phosphohistidine phosphatase SixA [Burkholderiaceae bacterium]|nr:phosphohistidine phosphatase SixA [Burkholderiaceae bacterium]